MSPIVLFALGAATSAALIGAIVLHMVRVRRSPPPAAASPRDPLIDQAEAIAGVGTWRWDARVDRVEWSAQLYRIYGVASDDFDGTYAGYLARVHPDDRARVRETVQRAFDAAAGFSLQERVVRPDGTVRWLETRGETVTDEGGTPLGMIGVCLDVTDRKHAEHTLAESEARYRQIVETTREGIWMIDTEGRTTFANRRMAEMLHCSLDELSAASMWDFTDEEARATAATNLERRRAGVAEQHEFRFRRLDGTYVWTLLETNPLCDDSGRPTGALALVTDITDRRAVEERMRTLIELSPEGIIVHVGSRILYANPAARELFAAGSPEDLVGRSVLDFVAPDARDDVARELAVAEETGAVRRGFERRVPLRDGRILDLEISAAPVLYAGERARQLVMRDITARKEAERALAREKAALEALIESAPESIVLADVSGRVLRVNREFTRLFGYTSAEAIGRPIDDLLAPDDRRFEAEALTKRTTRVRSSLETVRRRKDGRLLDVSVLGAPIPLAEGTVGVFGIYRDISERKQTERLLNSLLRVAKVLNSTLDLDRLLDALVREALALTGAAGGCAGLRGEIGLETQRYLRGDRWVELRYRWQPGQGLPGWLLQHRRPYVTNDAARDPEIAPALREELGVRSALSAPVLDSTGEVIAFFELHNAREAGGFSERDVRAVAALSDQVSIAIQNSLAYRRLEVARDALRRETAFAGMLQEVAVAANEAADATGAVRRCLEIVSRIGRWDLAHAFRFREGDETLEPTGIWTDDDGRWAAFRDATRQMVLGPTAGLPGRVLTARRPEWMEEFHNPDDFVRGAAMRRCGLKSALVVPALVGEKVVAILEFYATQPRVPDAEFLHVAGVLGAILGRVFEREGGRIQLQEARDRFASFFHSSPVATGIANVAEGRFREVNQRFLELLGLARDRVIGHTALELGVWPRLEDRDEMVRRLTAVGRLEDYEIRLRTTSGLRDVVATLQLIDLEGEPHILGSFVDVTERKRTERELAARASQQAAVAELGQAALEGRAPEALFERAVELVAGVLDVELCAVLEHRSTTDDFLLRAGVGWKAGLVGRATVPGGRGSQSGYTLELDQPVMVRDLARESRFTPPTLLREHKVRAGLSAVIPGTRRAFGVLGAHTTRAREFTDADLTFLRAVANVLALAIRRSRVEESLRASRMELRTLSHRLLEAQEAERARISRELHDHVGQVLSAVKLNLERVDQMSRGRAVQEAIQDSVRVVEEAIRQVRDLSYALRPSMLDDLGLAAAISSYANQQAGRAGVSLDLDVRGPERPIPQPLELACFRIVQEAVGNALRHAHPRRVGITVEARNGVLEAIVTDDGSGFDPAAMLAADGGDRAIGLLGMRERAELVGGDIAIESRPGRGTRVVCRLPLNA